MSIFKKIGQFFSGLFNAAKRTYNKLSPEQQAALVHGSGLMALINTMSEDAVADLRAAIKTKFPDLDDEKLERGLFDLLDALNIIKDDVNSIDDALKILQNHFAKLEGKVWAVASHFGASVLAILFAPAGTKVAAIVSLMEWVYQNFIKKAIPDDEDNE